MANNQQHDRFIVCRVQKGAPLPLARGNRKETHSCERARADEGYRVSLRTNVLGIRTLGYGQPLRAPGDFGADASFHMYSFMLLRQTQPRVRSKITSDSHLQRRQAEIHRTLGGPRWPAGRFPLWRWRCLWRRSESSSSSPLQRTRSSGVSKTSRNMFWAAASFRATNGRSATWPGICGSPASSRTTSTMNTSMPKSLISSAVGSAPVSATGGGRRRQADLFQEQNRTIRSCGRCC